MRRELLMPKLGLTMTEGTLVEWMVGPGGKVRAGEGLFVIESDKVTTEVPAERDAVLVETLASVGDVVAVGTVIGFVEEAGGASTGAAAATGPASDAVGATAAGGASAASTGSAHFDAAAGAAARAGAAASRIVATPLARRLAKQQSVDLATLAGSGPRGRIRADDVRAAASRPRVEPAPAAHADAVPVQAAVAAGHRRVAPTRTQATMARRLTAAKQQIPHFYLAAEAEVSRLLALRAELAGVAGFPKTTIGHFVVAAVARALREMPAANRVWTDDGIVQYDSVDVGVAVHSERGLVVPVLRGIERLPLAELASRAQALVERARTGSLRPDDVGGGAVTVSNAGMHEVTWMTPIVNPGQSMILGVGSVRDVFRPDAEGRPALRREIGLVLASDHRLVDGVSGLAFLNRVIASLRNPLPLLLT